MAMNSSLLNLVLDDEVWGRKIPEVESWANKVFATALDFLSVNDLGFEGWNNKPVSIALSLSNNDEVQKLNREFRAKDKPTNVLSFANIDDEAFEDEFLNEDLINIFYCYLLTPICQMLLKECKREYNNGSRNFGG